MANSSKNYSVQYGQLKDNESKHDMIGDSIHKNGSKNNKWCCFRFRIPFTAKINGNAINLLGFVYIMDILCCLLLLFFTHNWWFFNGGTFNWNDLYNDFLSFHDGTSDCILGFIIRLITIPIMSCIIVKKSVVQELWSIKDYGKCCCCVFICCRKCRNGKIRYIYTFLILILSAWINNIVFQYIVHV